MKAFKMDWDQIIENDEIDNYEIPKCIISVDLKGNISLIEILNSETADYVILDIIDEILKDYVFGDEILAGIYYVEIGIETTYSSNPENPDPDIELIFNNMKEIKINLEEIYK